MYPRILKYPKSNSFFLLGPRGTGKSSWLRSEFSSALYIDLLEDETFNTLLAYPQRLEDMVTSSEKSLVVIDEIQKIPKILDEVHRLIEKRKIRFVLTGSSARKLKRSGVNLLAGRALTLFMYPLTVRELGADFDLKHSLKHGQLPLAYTHSAPQKFLSSYVSTYLKEEVQQEGLTRNLAAFSRFLQAASFSQAEVLNMAEVARECSVERKTVEEYFTILEDLLLAQRIPVFTKRAKRDLVTHPKLLIFDVGVYRALRPKGPLDSPEEIDGHALETLFYQELRALNHYLDLGYELFYWRTRSKIEVDLVLYGERGLLAFEIKRASSLRSGDLIGLEQFLIDYPQAKAFCIYGGSKEYKSGKIHILPFERALKDLSDLM